MHVLSKMKSICLPCLSIYSFHKVWRIWLTHGNIPPRTFGACGAYRYFSFKSWKKLSFPRLELNFQNFQNLSTFTLFNFSDNEFYIFGGQHGYPDEDEDFISGNNNEIYRLNLVTLKWTHLEHSIASDAQRPLNSEKGIMTFCNGNLLVFGGYSEAPEPYRSHSIKPSFDFDTKSHYQWPR